MKHEIRKAVFNLKHWSIEEEDVGSYGYDKVIRLDSGVYLYIEIDGHPFQPK